MGVKIDIDTLTGEIQIERDNTGGMDFYIPPKESCINCEHFGWWDGDYCCVLKFRVLCDSPNGEFTDDILKNLKTPKTCNSYIQANAKHAELYEEPFLKFLEQKQCGTQLV
ncbi:MAG: hypothetical protein J6Y37_01865 [Paludibacteraceae bacterium]|nr:hypothetical protein [Paludibacteraceae bacterium]